MRNLSTIPVAELSHYADSTKLIKFIATLQNYNILTIQDLQSISIEEFCNFRGVGNSKIEKLQSLKTLLNCNLENIISKDEYASDDNSSFGEDTTEEFSKVPITYFISTLTEDKDRSALQSVVKYTKVENVGELCKLSESKLMNTPSLGLIKVQRVVSIQKRLKDEAYKKELARDYQNSLIIPILPSISGDTLAQDVLQFIKEYITLNQELNAQDSVAKCIELIFLHDYDITNAATHCGLSGQRVHQLVYSTAHPSFFKKLRQIVLGEHSEYDKPKFTLSEEFKAKLNKLSSNVRSGMLKSDFAHMIGLGQVYNVTHKKGVLMFLCELQNFKVFSGGVHKARVTNDYLINGKINDFKEVWGLVFTTLDSFVKPYIKEKLVALIQKMHPNIPSDAIDTVVGIIESDKDIFTVTKDGLATKYQLQWNALLSMQSRVERILYERQVSLQNQDIKNEYDRRIQAYGMTEPNVFLINKSENIFQVQEGGTWIWAEYANDDKTISLKSLIRQYVAQKQKFTIEEIIEYIHAEIPIANERSVKTLLAKYCKSTVEGYYIDKNCKEDFSCLHMKTSADIVPDLTKIMTKNQEYTYDELSKLYGNKYKISVSISKIRTTCDNNPNIFVVIRGDSRRFPNKVKINPEWNGVYEVKDRKRGYQAEWKQNVRAEMINKLRYSPGYEMESKELFKHIESFIPNTISRTGKYKILEDAIFIIKEKNFGKGKVVALNIEEWESEFKQQLANKENGASTYDYENREKTLQDAQKKQLSNPRYDMITNSDDDLNNLYASIKSFISFNLDKLKNNNMEIIDLEKTWSFMIDQMNIRVGGVDNAYYRMLNQLYGYMFGSTTRNDRYYLWVELRFNFEPYLKDLFRFKGLSTQKNDGQHMMLKDLIELCQNNTILPKRDEDCHITDCIKNILNKRNYRGHNAENTPNDTIIVQNIQKTITLYLYTSMQFMKIL